MQLSDNLPEGQTKPSGRALRSEQTRQKIMSAAEQVFSGKGLYGARVDEISLAAGVNKRMIYEYYGNKEELYKTVLENVYRRLGECEQIITGCSAEVDATEAIRMIIPAYFTFLRNNDSYVKMVMWENLNQAKYFDEKGLSDIRNPMKRALREIIQNGQTRGQFRPDIDVAQVLMTLFACTYNYFSNIHTMNRVMKTDLHSAEEIRQRVEHVTELLLRFLRAS